MTTIEDQHELKSEDQTIQADIREQLKSQGAVHKQEIMIEDENTQKPGTPPILTEADLAVQNTSMIEFANEPMASS